MSLAKRVHAAINEMVAKDYESALFQICVAIETTAAQEAGNSRGRGRTYKDFIHDNMRLITRVVGRGAILNINILYSHPEIESAPDGTCSLQDILYHAVRCGLYHPPAKLPDDLVFGEENSFKRTSDGKLQLPASLIEGLILAVVTSPANAANRSPENFVSHVRGHPIPLDSLWGKRDELNALLDAMNAFPDRPQPMPGENSD